MKRIWIALPLAALLALPVVAQQQNPPSSSSQATSQAADQNSQSQSQSADQNQASQQNPNGHQPLTLERHEGFWGKINPFARKKYVARQLSPVKDRVNELDQLTSENTKAIKDVDSRAQEGIRQASAKANEADQHAVDAGNRAQQAQQTADQANTKLTSVSQVVENIDQYKPVTQAEILFRPGQAALSTKAKGALDDMATPLKDQRGYIIEVQGFAPGNGQTSIANSQHMADSVVRYLVLNHDIPVYRIHVLGMGNAPVQGEDGKAERVRRGRVEVSLLKNDLEQLSAGSQAAPQTDNQGGMSGAAAQSAPTQNSDMQAPAGAANPAGKATTSPNKDTKKPTPAIPHQ
jgi:outer membrane protein OmpA-like peptidoglycan-associated protein